MDIHVYQRGQYEIPLPLSHPIPPLVLHSQIIVPPAPHLPSPLCISLRTYRGDVCTIAVPIPRGETEYCSVRATARGSTADHAGIQRWHD
eukprot:9328390-Pyramimonas_sp.AAC.1